MVLTLLVPNAITTFVANSGSQNYYVGADISVVSATGLAIDATSGVFSRGFEIDGVVAATAGSALKIGSSGALAGNNTVVIGQTGHVYTPSNTGIDMYSNGGSITNAGAIQGFYGVALTGSDLALRNTGTIFGESAAISVDGTGMSLTNKGNVSGNYGVLMTTNTGETNRIDNSGTIAGSINAISGSAGNETIVNSGKIYGWLWLGDGKDTFVNKGAGMVQGQIRGENGDDRYTINRADLNLVEDFGKGNDVVLSSATYTLHANFEKLVLTGKADLHGTGNSTNNSLTGNGGDNVLHGGLGFDILSGGRGTDQLFGDGGPDIFVFKPNQDIEIIRDFELGTDSIQLISGKDIISVEDLIAHHAHNDGADLVIEGDGTTMIIKHFQLADLGDAFP